ECARTPMQWTSEPHGGFSRARKVIHPVIDDEQYGYRKVNVADQRRDPHSLLNWTERMIPAREERPGITWGQFTTLPAGVPEVLVLRYDWRNTALVTVHNFAGRGRKARIDVGRSDGRQLVDVFGDRHSQAGASGVHEIRLEAYGHRWFRVGAADNAL